MKLALSMHISRFSKFLVHLECIPLPGPPEENELAVPNTILNML